MAASIIAGSDPVRLIQDALRGSIADVLRQQIPDLQGMNNDRIYDSVLDSPDLLDRSFKAFRANPAAFATQVRDAQGRPVTDDDGQLECGRTLGEAVTLVVQATGRRYFRSKLGGPRKVEIRRPPAGLGQRLMVALRLAPPPKRAFKRVPGHGDRLFQAIRAYLRFDWQAALLPMYTPLTPEQVTRLGERLWDIREPAELLALTAREERANLAGGRPPLFLDGASRLIKANGDTIDPEILWKVFAQMDLGRLLTENDQSGHRRAIAVIAGTSKDAIDQLMPVLGADLRQFVTFLFVAYAELGEEEYRRIFGADAANGWMVKRLADRLVQILPLPPPALEAMRQAYAALVRPPAANRPKPPAPPKVS